MDEALGINANVRLCHFHYQEEVFIANSSAPVKYQKLQINGTGINFNNDLH